MPFAAPLLDDENDPNKNKNGGVNISGQSTTVSTGVPGQEAAAPGQKQKSSGQYTNIQSYLDANKEQGDSMGGKIAGDVTNKAEDATSKIGAYESKAPTVAAYDPNEAIGRATSLTDQEKNTYKTNKATGGYSGPQNAEGIEGYQAANTAGTAAATAVKNAGTESGQRDLLKQTYARPDYSAGQNNLDQALIQGSAGSKAKLEGVGQKYSGLTDYLNGANQKVGNAVNSAVTQSYNNRQAFNPAETAARQNLINPIQARADQTRVDQEKARALGEDVRDNVLSEETLKALGLTEGQDLYDLNLNDYTTIDQTPAGLDNVANADERGKYAALSSLFDDPTMGQITANGKDITPFSFDKTKFDKDQSTVAEYGKAYKTPNPGIIAPNQFHGSGLNTASPEELEKVYIPKYLSLGGVYAQEADAIQSILNNWKSKYELNSKYNPNRKIVKG